jgi:hypothetical protein
MPDPSYVIETNGRLSGLSFHLDTAFYPPIPVDIKGFMMDVFMEYWEGKIPIEDLDAELAKRAGYIGGVGKYNFYLFLNEEDLNDD